MSIPNLCIVARGAVAVAQPEGPHTRIALMNPLASAACAVASDTATVNAPVSRTRFITCLLSLTGISRRDRQDITRNTLWRVGQEIVCTASSDGRRAEGRAQLETDELLFRGDGLRLRIPYSSITDVRAADGVLEVDHEGATSTFDLGDKAARWADRIKNPKTVIDKLGVKPGQRVVLHGIETDGFGGELTARGAELVERGADHLFVAVETHDDLAGLRALVPLIERDGAVWTVRRKGRKDLTESDVMAAGKAAGLVDVKVVHFSETHTAEKFVIPVADR
jgi:hypothetical protein